MTEQEINNLTTSECWEIMGIEYGTHFFDLIVFYEIEFMPDTGNGYGAFNVDHRVVFRDKNAQTAVLKAIIHKKGI